MTQWIAAIARGHNSGVCLLKDGELVLSIEEERFSRKKYDGGPLASMIKILDYTCLLYTSPSPRDRTRSRMPSSA